MDTKVVNKTLMILEAVSRNVTATAQEIEYDVAIPRSTCMRLLRDLTESGYLETIPRKGGYCLGPLAYKLCNGSVYMPSLTHPAEEIMKSMCQEYNISMQLSIRHEDFRCVLCGVNGKSNVLLDCDRPRFYDLLKSISGRMLLAYAPEQERRYLISKLMPASGNGPYSGMCIEEIEMALDDIISLKTAFAVHQGRVAICTPVKRHDTTVAVIGAVWHQASDTEKKHDEIIRELELKAQLLSSGISPF